MNLRQLVRLCEVVDHGLKLSAAAQSLHRSQPSITRQIQELEQELGVTIFARKRNKILELTPEGCEILASARRILKELHNIRSASVKPQWLPAVVPARFHRDVRTEAFALGDRAGARRASQRGTQAPSSSYLQSV